MADVIVIGAINMDIHGFSDRSIVMGDSNPGKVRLSPGGVGRNIAQNLCLLGEKPELLTAVSDDFFGRHLEEYCREAGIGNLFRSCSRFHILFDFELEVDCVVIA